MRKEHGCKYQLNVIRNSVWRYTLCKRSGLHVLREKKFDGTFKCGLLGSAVLPCCDGYHFIYPKPFLPFSAPGLCPPQAIRKSTLLEAR